jgi:hypothetical protein
MVYPIVFFSAILLLTAASASAGLDLTPRTSEYQGEGLKFTQLTFSADNKQATYGPPVGWDYTGSSKQLLLRPRNNMQAQATISVAPMEAPPPFNDATQKKLTEELVASLPPGSTGVAVISQQLNPLMIERKETFLVSIKYTFGGLPYVRSVIFLNRIREQMRFQLVCREADFKDLQRAFQGSLFSWQNI